MQKLDIPEAQITLGYWAIRGLAQPIRFMLAYAGVPFNEIRLGIDQDGVVLSEEQENVDWQIHRETLTMPFPNLPYLIDTSGEVTRSISQSNAILRYLGRKLDLYGDNEDDRIHIDVLQDEAYDYRNKIVNTAYTLGEDYPEKLTDFRKNAVPHYLDGFEEYLTGRKSIHCFAGNRLSLVDFVVYELLWQTSLMIPGCISENKQNHLHRFMRTFEQIPEISGYMTSKSYLERPVNMPWASFT